MVTMSVMNRSFVTTMAALTALTTLPGCTYFEQRELKKGLEDCLSLNGALGRESNVLDTDPYFTKYENEPLTVTLEFRRGGEVADLKIVEIAHWAPTQDGDGAKERAARLSPKAKLEERSHTSIETLNLLYERKDGEWQARSASRLFKTVEGRAPRKLSSGREHGERPTETYSEEELMAGLVRPFNPDSGPFQQCLVDKRLTQAK